MRAGDVFRFVGIADIHVWMIISDPARDADRVLIVNFTTWESHIDHTAGRLQLLHHSLSDALLRRVRESAMNSVTLSFEAGDILVYQELVD